MPTAELIAIGTEILLGEIVDTNTQYLARQLRDCGIDLFRSTAVGDNVQRISQLMIEALSRADILITTGGLGPTVDDPTRDAAALAFGIQNEFHPELWLQIQQRFQRRGMVISENNKKQAFIPFGAAVIENPVGTAPAFILHSNGKTLICLPGVPHEMEALTRISVIPWLKEHFKRSGTIKAKVLHTSGVAESKVDELVGDLELLDNPSVGLLAHPGIVDIRITAKAESTQAANRMIQDLETIIRKRLGNDIYGVNEETLSISILNIVEKLQIPIKIFVSGFLPDTFRELVHPKISLESFTEKDFQTQYKTGSALFASHKNIEQQCIFTCKYFPPSELAKVELAFFSDAAPPEFFSREYSGAPELRDEWAYNFTHSFIHRQLISLIVNKGDS